ncbi:hypothetical protein ACQRXC_08620 [Niallia taxi]|uniref:hypothetical protein n=1 Tax=Niallia taxi TaxID=2499688 RepID=UPI003F647032
MQYSDTTYWGLYKTKGIKFYINWSLFWSLLITGSIILTLGKYSNLSIQLKNIGFAINEPLIGASASIFGIVIASLTLTITLFHQSLLPIMLEKKLLHKFLFPFWKAVSLWGISISLCLLLIICENVNLLIFLTKYLAVMEIFIFLYSTFYTVGLTGLVIQLALQRAQMKN